MKFNFDEIVNRKNTGSVKWDNGEWLIKTGFTERFDEETLPLFTADMDFAVPPCISEAMHKVADNRIYGYTLPRPEYYDSIISWFKRRHKWEIKRKEIVYCPGTVHAVVIAIKAFTNPGDGVIIQRPVYYPFTAVIEDNERIVANNQMIIDEKGFYKPNLDEFELITKKPENKLFILCNPHNPSGRIFSNDDLKEMARICKENDVLIISDEIHGDLIRKDSTFTPIVKVADETDHIITCTAINKTFNVAGLHATNIVISNPQIKARFKKELGEIMMTPFAIEAVIAAYNEGEEWLEELKDYLDVTIDWVMEFIKKNLPKVNCVRPEGTYIFWMDFRGYGLSYQEVRKKIYVDANVILEKGQMFDPDRGAGFERICLSSPRPMIKEAFRRIAEVFKGM